MKAIVAAVLLTLVASSVSAADIYAVSVSLDAGEGYAKVKRLSAGEYKFTLTRTSGNGDDVRLEAELASGNYRLTRRCPEPTVEVTFNVAENDDIWEISITNTGDNKARLEAKLTKE